MMTVHDRKILEIISERQLVTKIELDFHLKKENINSDGSVKRLQEDGLIDTVESLGNCLVVTQKGLRALNGG